MAWYEIPLDPEDEQQFDIVVEVDGQSVFLNLHLRYNSEGDFWHMDVALQDTDEILISNVPLLTGEYPSADILAQFQHFGLGSAMIIKASDDIENDFPSFEEIGTDFILVWGSGDVE